MIRSIQLWWRKHRYRVGRTLTQFIAQDISRDVEIVDVSRLTNGYISARVRTTNVLYSSKGLVPETEFEQPREIAIAELWHWSGQPWGGLPDGTSLVDAHHPANHATKQPLSTPGASKEGRQS